MAKDRRDELLAGALRLLALDLTAGLSGNLSLAEEDGIWITPSGMPYPDLGADDLVWVARDGSRITGRRQPSVELGMHLACYRARTDIGAVVHAHPTAVIALAMLGEGLPCVTDSLAGAIGGGVPCLAYQPSASQALADSVAVEAAHHPALILASHGLVTTGPGLEAAIDLALLVERTAQSYLKARAIGAVRVLPDDVAASRRRFVLEQYGQHPKAEK